MKQKTIIKIIEELNKIYSVKPWREDPFKVLIITILSQRTKDEITRKVSKRLFKSIRTPNEILRLTEKQLASLIYPVGFYRQKAKKIKKLCKILLEKYDGKVPATREELLKLPGVGDKTADVVICYGHGIPSIAIDTHCNRISKRLGLVSPNASLREVKRVLEELFPKEKWHIVNLGFVNFGKKICRSIKPICNECPFKSFCNYFKYNK